VHEDDDHRPTTEAERPIAREFAIAAGLVVLSVGAGALLALLV
jgi:hypothetical protein